MIVDRTVGALAEQDKLRPVVQRIENGMPDEIQPLLWVQAADESDDGLFIVRQPKALPQRPLVIVFFLESLRVVMAGDVGVRLGIEHLIVRSEEHTSELQSPCNLVCRLLLEKKKKESIL